MNLSDINFVSVCLIPLGIAIFAAFLQPFLEHRTNLFKSNEIHEQSSNRDWSRAVDIAVRKFKAIQSGFDWDAHYVNVESANFPKKGQREVILEIYRRNLPNPILVDKYRLFIDRTGDFPEMKKLSIPLQPVQSKASLTNLQGRLTYEQDPYQSDWRTINLERLNENSLKVFTWIAQFYFHWLSIYGPIAFFWLKRRDIVNFGELRFFSSGVDIPIKAIYIQILATLFIFVSFFYLRKLSIIISKYFESWIDRYHRITRAISLLVQTIVIIVFNFIVAGLFTYLFSDLAFWTAMLFPIFFILLALGLASGGSKSHDE